MQESLADGCLVTSITHLPRGKGRADLEMEREEGGRKAKTTLLGDLPPHKHVFCSRKFCIVHGIDPTGFSLELKCREGF